jgi:hypothetical protein
MASIVAADECAVCETGTTQKCASCLEGLDGEGNIITATFYCSKSCQQADLAFHRQSCKQLKHRKVPYRTGKLAQDIFYAFREQTFETQIGIIEDKDGGYVIEVKKLANSYYYNFPSGATSSIEVKKALLAWSSSNDATVCLSSFIKDCLKGELFFQLLNKFLTTVHRQHSRDFWCPDSLQKRSTQNHLHGLR